MGALIVSLAACGAATATPTSAPPTSRPPTQVPTVVPPTPIVDDPNTVTTASGLKYVELVVGTGPSPASTDWVTLQFTVTLQDGTLIGSTRKFGKPADMPLDGIADQIKGWAEGVSTMQVGGTRQLVIPPHLAYGSAGSGNIPPDATLLFTIDLLATRPAPEVKIEDTRVGTGLTVGAGMSLTVNYTGTLTDGTVFDTSVGKRPFTFVLGVGEVIAGWDTGLVGMKVGGQRKLTIPSELGYGPQGSDPIPPNATLIFEVELLDAN
jgi:FKBP-type peptidyl-prolyl cis-trans isomerase